MIRDFSREELEPVSASNHTELTLGLGTLLGLGAGLLLLCIVCFALGYAAGHRSSANQSAAIVLPDSKLRPSRLRNPELNRGRRPHDRLKCKHRGWFRAGLRHPDHDRARSDSDSDPSSRPPYRRSEGTTSAGNRPPPREVSRFVSSPRPHRSRGGWSKLPRSPALKMQMYL